MFKGCPANIGNFCACGSAGPTGPQGIQGPAGPQGPTGSGSGAPDSGFQVSYTDALPIPASNVSPVVATSTASPLHNDTGVYDPATGIATLDYNGKYQVNLYVRVENGAESYINSYTFNLVVNGTPTIFSIFDDMVPASKDYSNAAGFTLSFPAGTTISVDFNYTGMGSPGVSSVILSWGLYLLTET